MQLPRHRGTDVSCPAGFTERSGGNGQVQPGRPA